MQTMIKIGLGLGLVLGLISASQAKAPTKQQVLQWLTNKDTKLTGSKIEVTETQPVVLASGEQAYLSAVDYPNGARNFSAGYILTRPDLQQSRQLQDFLSQGSGIKILSQKRKPTLVDIHQYVTSAGEVHEKFSVVGFDGWHVKKYHSYANINTMAARSEGPCEDTEVNIKLTEGPPAQITETTQSRRWSECSDDGTLKNAQKSRHIKINW